MSWILGYLPIVPTTEHQPTDIFLNFILTVRASVPTYLHLSVNQLHCFRCRPFRCIFYLPMMIGRLMSCDDSFAFYSNLFLLMLHSHCMRREKLEKYLDAQKLVRWFLLWMNHNRECSSLSRSLRHIVYTFPTFLIMITNSKV